MITSNVMQRVFRLKYGNGAGTCFIIEVDGTQYFVTARHVLQTRDEQGVVQGEMVSRDNIEIVRNNVWVSIPTLNVKHSDEADVSIFTIAQHIPAHPLPATDHGISYGQDVYFLGFPYGMSSDIGELNRNFPLPFVRKGILSTLHAHEPGRPFIIDGHNNPGFSGGPVVFREGNNNSFKVAAVIHGYNPEYRSENGQLVPIENTNSGMVIAYPISNALNLITLLRAELNTNPQS